MKNYFPSVGVGLLCLVTAFAQAQTPNAPATRPDARYPNPSGQDSNPSQTVVKPTTQAPASKNPEDARTSTKGDAAHQTFEAGKRADASAGCSTPADAASAGVTPSTAQPKRADGKRAVCTTAGGEGSRNAKNPPTAKSAEASKPSSTPR
jgi:hypothetical protein